LYLVAIIDIHSRYALQLVCI